MIYRRLTAGHCTLNQRTAECGREPACYGKIRSTGCGLPVDETEERAVRLQNYIPQGAAIFKACATAAPACIVCPFLPTPFALRTYIYIILYILYTMVNRRTFCLKMLRKMRPFLPKKGHRIYATTWQYLSSYGRAITRVYIYIYIYIAKSRMEHDHWPRFARLCSPLSNNPPQANESTRPDRYPC